VEIEEVHPNEKQQLTSFNVQLFKNLEQQNMKGYITIFGFHQKFIKTSRLKGEWKLKKYIQMKSNNSQVFMCNDSRS
jgi:hypothetical protein